MSQNDYYERDGGGNQGATGWLRSEGREPGARRRKFAGYLKAANELRQSYQQSYSGWRSNQQTEDFDDGTPGAFPDAAIVRNGEEEMILFPSYARRHVKRKARPQQDGLQDSVGQNSEGEGPGNEEFWREAWEQHEDEHAIVDVDVRGWIYTPHKGALNRKHRLFVGLARQLAGIQVPSAGGNGSTKFSPPESSVNSRTSSPSRATHRDRFQAKVSRQEEELVSKEAESIMRRGEAEAAMANKGEYSELPARSEADNIRSVSRSPASDARRHPLSRISSASSLRDSDGQSLSPLQRRATRNPSSTLSPAEMHEANTHLMARLMPFLANPVGNTTISVFFFNDEKSRQKTVVTDPSGHFTVRAALEFLPTHVRVLASDKLSVTEEVHITEPQGVSVISDIDDTIKHTAINSGAREIFRNAFVRDLGDLVIEGVKDWYNHLSKLGVQFHYVSNSPWQLFPVLTQYFSMAGLPRGSFHLKQYSGMLQGIFEPVAERKKGTLDRIARDFPERRFILVGDSGEADLEVYTDFVLENPGRVLAVFIRDITTPESSGFFDSSMGPLAGERNSRQAPDVSSRNNAPYETRTTSRTILEENEDPELKAAIEASLREFDAEEKRRHATGWIDHADSPQNRPKLPPRKPTDPGRLESQHGGPTLGSLIDLSDDGPSSAPPTPPWSNFSKTTTEIPSLRGMPSKDSSTGANQPPPIRPKKPTALRAPTVESSTAITTTTTPPKPTPKKPPPPPKPRRTPNDVQDPSASLSKSISEKRSQSMTIMKATAPINPPASSNEQGYVSSARQKLNSVYNNLPSATSYFYGRDGSQTVDNEGNGGSNLNEKTAPPPPPPRRTVTSYPVAAAQCAGSRINSLYNGNNPSLPTSSQQYSTASSSDRENGPGLGRTETGLSTTSTQAPNKREELWRRRWARAQEILGERGVLLRSWRIGTDVMEESVKLVESALKEDQEAKKELQRKD